MKKQRKTKKTPKATKKLLDLGTNETEGNVESSITSYLTELGIQHEVRTNRNSVQPDIHLQHRKVIIEAKIHKRLEKGPYEKNTGSLGDESAFEQLGRYITPERRQSRLDDDEKNKRSTQWYGCVTDGKRWWIWEYPLSGHGDKPEILSDWKGKELKENNLKHLERILKRENYELGKIWIPKNPSKLFEDVHEELKKLYGTRKGLRSTSTQEELWYEQLKSSGNNPSEVDKSDLFVTHTLLILISRFVSGMKYDKNQKKSELFDGFVRWVNDSHEIIEQIQNIVNEYDWTSRDDDVLRSLYHDFIPIEQRKAYGEYYTPDWLAEKICIETIDDDYIQEQIKQFKSNEKVYGILDPACGSGTFLIQAVKLLKNSEPVKKAYFTDTELLNFICQMIVGIDIHPVAVEMTISNMCRILDSCDRSNLRIYQGDSLLIDRGVETETIDYSIVGKTISITTPKKAKIVLPLDFANNYSDLEKFVKSARDKNPLPVGVGGGGILTKEQKTHVKSQHEEMTKIIKKEGNGIWAWYIKNQIAPTNLSNDKVGVIVSNAPWVTFNKINNENRKEQIKNLATKMDLWVGGKTATQFDLASLFVSRCMMKYFKGKKAGWVLPGAAITGETFWKKTREKFQINEEWKLGNIPFPKQGTSSVLILGKNKKCLELKIKAESPKPDTNDLWNDVKDNLEFKEVKKMKKSPSGYLKSDVALARNGATLYPHVLLKIDEITEYDNDKIYFKTKSSRNKPWKTLGSLEGNVPKSWVYDCLSRDDLVPYCTPTRTKYILPIKEQDWDDDRFDEDYWEKISDHFRDRIKDKELSLENNINFSSKLLSQFESFNKKSVKCFIVYNKSGARIFSSVVEGKIIIDNSLYRLPCSSSDEAYYLTAVLNANCLVGAFEETMENDRDFNTLFWSKIPILKFNPKNKDHKELAKLAKQASKEVKKLVSKSIKTRTAISEKMEKSETSKKIDEKIKKILPKYVDLHDD